MPVANEQGPFSTFNYTLTNTEPVWAYCRQAGHCSKGMVFAINPNENGTHNFAAFQAIANGSSSSSNSSSPSGSTKSGAAQIGFGFATLLFPLAFLGFALQV